jgi:hypothetical protein
VTSRLTVTSCHEYPVTLSIGNNTFIFTDPCPKIQAAHLDFDETPLRWFSLYTVVIVECAIYRALSKDA